MADVPIHSMTDVWNNVLTKFYGAKMNVTDTASDPDSRLIEWQIGGTPYFSVKKSGQILTRDGTAPLPAFSFESDPNTGVFRSSADVLGFVAGGAMGAYLSTTALVSSLPFIAAVGAVGNPSITFLGDLNTGFYWVGADQIGITTGGVLRATISTTAIESTLPLIAPGASAAAPALAPTSAFNAGIWWPSSVSMAFSASGNEAGRIDAARFFLWGQSAQGAPGVGNNVAGTGLSPGGALAVSRAGAPALTLNRETNDGGVAQFYRLGVNVGSIAVSAGATAYNTSSDYRLKTVIDWPEDYDNDTERLDRILTLDGALCWFVWKQDEEQTKSPQLGALAHVWQKVSPGSVTGEKDAMQDIWARHPDTVLPDTIDPETGKTIPGEVIPGEMYVADRVIAPQGIDWSKEVPGLIAGQAALLRYIRTLESRIAQLEGA